VLQPVVPQEAAGLVPLKDTERSELEKKVDGLRRRTGALDSNSPGVRQEGRPADRHGPQGDRRRRPGASNRFLDRPVKAIDSDTASGADLTQLRSTVEALDPKRNGRSPRQEAVRADSRSASRSRTTSASIRARRAHQRDPGALQSGKDELLMDNAAIDTERANLWKTMHKLEQMIHISKALDAKLEEKAAELDATEPMKAKAIRETRCSTRGSGPPTC
jgi:hypothetical protein